MCTVFRSIRVSAKFLVAIKVGRGIHLRARTTRIVFSIIVIGMVDVIHQPICSIISLSFRGNIGAALQQAVEAPRGGSLVTVLKHMWRPRGAEHGQTVHLTTARVLAARLRRRRAACSR